MFSTVVAEVNSITDWPTKPKILPPMPVHQCLFLCVFPPPWRKRGYTPHHFLSMVCNSKKFLITRLEQGGFGQIRFLFERMVPKISLLDTRNRPGACSFIYYP